MDDRIRLILEEPTIRDIEKGAVECTAHRVADAFVGTDKFQEILKNIPIEVVRDLAIEKIVNEIVEKLRRRIVVKGDQNE